VDDDAPNDPGPGDPTVSDPLEDGSAEHPFDAIQEGIDAAVDGDTVLVLDGTYTGEGNKNLDFDAKAITVRSASGDPDVCIIDCERAGRGFYFHSGEGPASVVAGFTIRNGFADYGGGVYYAGGNPTISNCTIMQNEAAYGGGGIYCNRASPTISNCTIMQNEADIHGGGIYCNTASPTISNCTITGNTASGWVGGGGIYCYAASPTISNCTISQNEVEWWGRGLLCDRSNPTIINCTIAQNSSG